MVWFAYLESWARFWGACRQCEPAMTIQWLVRFGDLVRPLSEIRQQALLDIIAPARARIAQALMDSSAAGLQVVFSLHPSRGLTWTLEGPDDIVARARELLAKHQAN
jgi:hypothetical protein